MNASEIRAYVSSHVKHNYDTQTDTLDPEVILREGRGRCGQRSAVFQYLAKENGIRSRIVIYRGHVSCEVYENGAWKDCDPTTPETPYHAELLAHIKAGPIIGYSTDPDYRKQPVPPIALGEYSSRLKKLGNVNFLLPRDLLHGKTLDPTRPNIILRHDICHLTSESRRAWMGMVHEENQLGLRSVSYLPVEAVEHVPLFKMFEHEGFEIGLHSTAITSHDMWLSEVILKFNEQLEFMKWEFNVKTVQAHGYDDKHGLPRVTYTQLDETIPYSFRNLVDLNPAFDGRVADSMGVMTPNIDAFKPENGKLYYCLWHPEYYEISDGWVRYFGLQQDGNLQENLPKLNRIIGDTAYFNDIQKPHLLATVKIIDELLNGGLVLDLAAGWGILGLLIPNRFAYIAVDSEYKRMKAAQALSQSLYKPLPDFRCVDFEQASLPSAECVVLIGWEGDLHHKPDFQKLAELVKPGGLLIVSFIYETRPTYTTMPRTEIAQELQNNSFETITALTPQPDFPRELIVAKKQ